MMQTGALIVAAGKFVTNGRLQAHASAWIHFHRAACD